MASKLPAAISVSQKAENEVEAKHDHLITELESSEGHTPSTLR